MSCSKSGCPSSKGREVAWCCVLVLLLKHAVLHCCSMMMTVPSLLLNKQLWGAPLGQPPQVLDRGHPGTDQLCAWWLGISHW